MVRFFIFLIHFSLSAMMHDHLSRKDFQLVEAIILGNKSTTFIQDLIANGANVNATDQEGNTPLVTACVFGRTRYISVFIRAGADVNAGGSAGTPLEVALAKKNFSLIKELAPYVDMQRVDLDSIENVTVREHLAMYLDCENESPFAESAKKKTRALP